MWTPALRRRAVTCADGRHALPADRLVLRTPTLFEARVALAAGSDADAQRWLGWDPGNVYPEVQRRHLIAARAEIKVRGRRTSGRERPELGMALVALDPRRRVHAGLATVTHIDARTCEIGGYLGPDHRGQGLGTELFAAALNLAHQHLGYEEVRAGTETGNHACAVSLGRAGFAPAEGPDFHILPDGRVVPAAWFASIIPTPATCAVGRPDLPLGVAERAGK